MQYLQPTHAQQGHAQLLGEVGLQVAFHNAAQLQAALHTGGRMTCCVNTKLASLVKW
jgi:hypothetical protein